MNSSKIWRIVWVSGIYAILLVILYLVITYKVQWEHKDLNTYLYFYDCGHELCTSSNKIDDYYSKIMCEKDICPYIDMIIGDNLILKKSNEKSYIYNYKTDSVINNEYINYKYIGDNMFVVNDSNSKYGIIDINGKIIVELKYDEIMDYKDGIVSYLKNGLYGIVSIDNKYNINPTYDDVVLINDKIFASKENNVYKMHAYDDLNSENSNVYNYVYTYKDVIFTIKDKKIDILDNNLNSLLLMKIDTQYDYSVEQERDSLDIYSDCEIIYFKVFMDDKYINYKFNVVDKKLI